MWSAASFHGGQPPAHPAGGQDEDRQQDQGQQGDLPGDLEHHGQREYQRNDVGDDTGQRVAECPLRADHVVVQPADQRPGPSSGEEGDRHPLHMGENGPAQVEDQALTDPRGQPAADQADRRLEKRDHRNNHRQPDDRRHLAVAHDGVHDLPSEDGGGDDQHSGYDAE